MRAVATRGRGYVCGVQRGSEGRSGRICGYGGRRFRLRLVSAVRLVFVFRPNVTLHVRVAIVDLRYRGWVLPCVGVVVGVRFEVTNFLHILRGMLAAEIQTNRELVLGCRSEEILLNGKGKHTST